jgi:hypothetical protein
MNYSLCLTSGFAQAGPTEVQLAFVQIQASVNGRPILPDVHDKE